MLCSSGIYPLPGSPPFYLVTKNNLKLHYFSYYPLYTTTTTSTSSSIIVLELQSLLLLVISVITRMLLDSSLVGGRIV